MSGRWESCDKNLQKQEKLVRNTWDKKWKFDKKKKFGVFKFKEIRKRLESVSLKKK